jgi:hypothetical protein
MNRLFKGAGSGLVSLLVCHHGSKYYHQCHRWAAWLTCTPSTYPIPPGHDIGRKLRALGIEPWIEPQAGMFLWCRLPDGLDAADVSRAALANQCRLRTRKRFQPSPECTQPPAVQRVAIRR